MSSKLKNALFIFVLTLARFIFFLFCPVKAYGKENIPKDKGVILCPNHVSMYDIVCMVLTVPRRVHFMAKAELFNKPIKRFFLDVGQAFPVSRGRGDTQAITHAIELINQNEMVCIFVEGTRTKNQDGSPGKAKPGAIYIASQANCDIIPVAICYKHNKPRLFSKNYVYYGEAIPSEEIKIDTSSRQQVRAACESIMSKIRTLWETGKSRWQK